MLYLRSFTKHKGILTVFFMLFIFGFNSRAEELSATVNILSPTLQPSDKKVLESLQTAIMEFLNNRKWSDDNFLNQERIEFSLQLNVTKRVSSDEFEATAQISASRPTFKTAYNTRTLNFNDENFNFKYVENSPLEFNEQTHGANLTAMLSFYVNIILGVDYDSFSMNGGEKFFQKAMTIVNNAQSEALKGWKAYETSKNRYWLIENILNPQFKKMREATYKFHRLGLDIMSEKPDDGRKVITEAIELVHQVYKDKPGSLLLKVFFDTKSDELVNIYSGAYPDEKGKMVSYLNEMDPSNSSKYARIMSAH